MAKKANKSGKKKRSRRRAFKVFLTCLILLILCGMAVRFIVFVPVYIKTNGMAPAYRKGDIVYADKLTMWKDFRVEREDVVYAAFGANGEHFIRRVKGMPGDVIDVRDGQRFLVVREKGIVVDEIALGDAPGLVYGEIPAGAYLLLADDLTLSGVADSRALGLVKEIDITAVPGPVLWPLTRALRSK